MARVPRGPPPCTSATLVAGSLPPAPDGESHPASGSATAMTAAGTSHRWASPLGGGRLAGEEHTSPQANDRDEGPRRLPQRRARERQPAEGEVVPRVVREQGQARERRRDPPVAPRRAEQEGGHHVEGGNDDDSHVADDGELVDPPQTRQVVAETEGGADEQATAPRPAGEEPCNSGEACPSEEPPAERGNRQRDEHSRRRGGHRRRDPDQPGWHPHAPMLTLRGADGPVGPLRCARCSPW